MRSTVEMKEAIDWVD